jgi:hypothetical protein
MGFSSMSAPSNRFHVNLVVLTMGADETDEHQSTIVAHQYHEPVIVALNIEYHPGCSP